MTEREYYASLADMEEERRGRPALERTRSLAWKPEEHPTWPEQGPQTSGEDFTPEPLMPVVPVLERTR